ncbi:uncharacterized protein BJ171DRAFT_581406 [Polychytrium aggregatum]|uniref:uncharacterized protein n=1 Tax=Polychytrium aggregatum TaxID=110093 RepID=UPI0022FE9735|nr:uncharacterized protein BJ171DRAFT_581406 [Polychytrium aggregatum]KAI9205202.1 hypothetical protein BJ171DRAFT_581406 [Polychytrium aggregatum]
MPKSGAPNTSGQNGFPKNIASIVPEFKRFFRWCCLGSPFNTFCKLLLAQWYLSGMGTSVDEVLAAGINRVLVEEGCECALVQLGNCYYSGQGVTRNSKAAFKLYERAAKLGNAEGQYSLGYCFLHGTGVSSDRMLALSWVKKAAAQSHPDAMIMLQEMLNDRLLE